MSAHPHPGPVAPWRVLSRRAFVAMLVIPPFAIVACYGAAVTAYGRLAQPPEPVASARVHVDGGQVFRQHCANCHGERGDGNGAAQLVPRARYFGFDRWKLAGTDTGEPTDTDLLRVLDRGIPGSAMYSFSHLPEDHRRAVVAHVRTLAFRGTVERLAAKAVKDGDEPDYAELRPKAAELCRPGTPITVPEQVPASSPEAVARGRQVFVSVCAQCHGPQGLGDGPQVATMKNDNGTEARPRNLTLGLYKYGGDPQSLYVRLRLGIPGTPMPAQSPAAMPDDQLFDLIHYVRSLAAPAQEPGT